MFKGLDKEYKKLDVDYNILEINTIMLIKLS